MDITPIESLFAEGSETGVRPEARVAIARADVIVGVDADTQNEFTVYGTPALEESVQLGREVALRTVRIRLSQRAGELDKLVSLVRAIKRGQDSTIQ
jgi:hypothetical protein